MSKAEILDQIVALSKRKEEVEALLVLPIFSNNPGLRAGIEQELKVINDEADELAKRLLQN